MRKAFLMLVLWSVSCLAQTALNFELSLYHTIAAPTLGSTRSFAMGGVFSATNSGVEALTGNPAGLVFCNGSQILASARMRMSGNDGADSDYYKVIGFQDYSRQYQPGFKLGNLGIAFPISLPENGSRIIGAIGYRSYYDLSYKQEEEFESIVGGDQYSTTYEQMGMLNVMTFGAGFQVNEQFNLGVVFNLPMFSGYELEVHQDVRFSQNSQIGQTYTETADVSGNGFLHLGAMFNVTPRLVLGATYTFGHKYELNDEEWTNTDQYGRGGIDTQKGDYEDIEFEVPSYWSLGASYLVSPNLLVAAELQNRPWEDFEINNYDLSSVTESGTTWRVGAELGREVKFRVGYYSDSEPLLDADKDGVSKSGFTGGLGLTSGSLNVDLGLVFQRMQYDIIYTTSYSPEPVDAEYNETELLIYATLSYGFDFVLGGD